MKFAGRGWSWSFSPWISPNQSYDHPGWDVSTIKYLRLKSGGSMHSEGWYILFNRIQESSNFTRGTCFFPDQMVWDMVQLRMRGKSIHTAQIEIGGSWQHITWTIAPINQSEWKFEQKSPADLCGPKFWRLPYTNYHGNPKPSFLEVITHILRA